MEYAVLIVSCRNATAILSACADEPTNVAEMSSAAAPSTVAGIRFFTTEEYRRE